MEAPESESPLGLQQEHATKLQEILIEKFMQNADQARLAPNGILMILLCTTDGRYGTITKLTRERYTYSVHERYQITSERAYNSSLIITTDGQIMESVVINNLETQGKPIITLQDHTLENETLFRLLCTEITDATVINSVCG